MSAPKRGSKTHKAAVASTDTVPALEARLAAAPSPFSDAVLPNAFRDTPDVPSIHGDVRVRLLELLSAARAEGTSALQVVTGDAGEGKTHILAWLRRLSEDGWRPTGADARFALAIIPPLRSLERARHHVLQELVRQLATLLPSDVHVDRATDTPIEILLWRGLLGVARLVMQSPRVDPALAERLTDVLSSSPDKYLSTCVAQLSEAWPRVGASLVQAAQRLPELEGADREVLRVLARFPDGDDTQRMEIVDWIGGASLAAERVEALGTGLVLDDEDGAAKGLKTILALARVAKIPIVLAFDQIEGIERLGDDAVHAFVSAIADLYNDCPGTVLLVLCQSQLWPRLRRRAAQHVLDRLDTQPALNLKALTPFEALALVEKRLTHFWSGLGEAPPRPLYPLDRDRVLRELERTPLRTPRAVMRHFQALLREPPDRRETFVGPAPISELDVVTRKLGALVEEERRRQPRSPDQRAELADGMVREVLLAARDRGITIARATVEEVARLRVRKTGIEGLRFSIARGEQRRRVYVEASNSQHGKSAAATAKRLADAVDGGHADRAVLLREEAFPLPPAAKETLAQMSPRGVVVWLKDGELAPLAALESLLNAAAARDIPVDRKTALDLALAQLSGQLGLIDRLVDAAFGDEDGTALPLDGEAVQRVHDYLRTQRAFEPLANLGATLGIPIDRVHSVVRELEGRGFVQIVRDRNRAQVVLLRPEGFA